MKIMLLLIGIALICGCTSPDSPTRHIITRITPKHGKPGSNKKGVVFVKGKSSYTYQFKNDTIQQKIVISNITADHISFNLSSVNNHGNKENQLTGFAKTGLKDNYEIDQDDDGYSYPSKEYVYRSPGGCKLRIRIDADENNKIQIPLRRIQCEKLSDLNSPLYSIGVLRLTQ